MPKNEEICHPIQNKPRTEISMCKKKKTTNQRATVRHKPGMSSLLAKHTTTHPDNNRQRATATNGNTLHPSQQKVRKSTTKTTETTKNLHTTMFTQRKRIFV